LDGSSSNREWNFRVRISSSSDVPSSGEGSRAEYEVMEDEGLGSVARKSSWVHSHSSQGGSDLADKEVYSAKRGTPPVKAGYRAGLARLCSAQLELTRYGNELARLGSFSSSSRLVWLASQLKKQQSAIKVSH